jgi:hypothetical protein
MITLNTTLKLTQIVTLEIDGFVKVSKPNLSRSRIKMEKIYEILYFSPQSNNNNKSIH